MIAAQEPVQPDDYTRAWLVSALLVVAGWGSYTYVVRQTTLSQPPAIVAHGEAASWYLMLRMPEMTTQYESGLETMKVRFEEWIIGLKSAGYQPMLLSEVLQRRRLGRALPANAIVLVFNPGYRRTYEIVSPILARHGWPAVWLTDQNAITNGDRRYITYHTSRKMRRSGLWDVGFMRPDGRGVLRSQTSEVVYLGEDGKSAWATTAGAVALNDGPEARGLKFLTVTSNWLAPELVNRVTAERPIRRPMTLTKAIVEGREWGVSAPWSSQQDKVFALETPLHKRGSKLYWLGTKGLTQYAVKIQAGPIHGELALHLGTDPFTGQGTHVVFTQGLIVGQDAIDGEMWPLFSQPVPASWKARHIDAEIVMRHRVMTLRLNGQDVLSRDITGTPSASGILELYVADKVFGAARAENIRMTITPLQDGATSQ
jgi:hypothetical protein